MACTNRSFRNLNLSRLVAQPVEWKKPKRSMRGARKLVLIFFLPLCTARQKHAFIYDFDLRWFPQGYYSRRLMLVLRCVDQKEAQAPSPPHNEGVYHGADGRLFRA